MLHFISLSIVEGRHRINDILQLKHWYCLISVFNCHSEWESPVVICAVHYCQVSAFCCSARNEFSYWIRKQPKKPSYSAQLNLVWHRMLYSCTHMATVGVTGLNAAPKTRCLLVTMKFCVVMLCSYRVRRVPVPRNVSCTGPMCSVLMTDEPSGAGHVAASSRLHCISSPQEVPSPRLSVWGSDRFQQVVSELLRTRHLRLQDQHQGMCCATRSVAELYDWCWCHICRIMSRTMIRFDRRV